MILTHAAGHNITPKEKKYNKQNVSDSNRQHGVFEATKKVDPKLRCSQSR